MKGKEGEEGEPEGMEVRREKKVEGMKWQHIKDC